MQTVSIGSSALAADLTVPEEGAKALIIFAHGSGSSRHSERNRQVAAALNQRGLATLLMDLLTPDEETNTPKARFDIKLLAGRLLEAIDWALTDPTTARLPVGLFGASTGAAAAIHAAVSPERRDRVFTIVSRGGRVDLAGRDFRSVRVPVLLIVGSADAPVYEIACEALLELPRASRIEKVEGAGHLFEEPGAMEEVSRLAGDWFVKHIPAGSKDAGSSAAA